MRWARIWHERGEEERVYVIGGKARRTKTTRKAKTQVVGQGIGG
jgi:hypothetical protein